MSDAEHLIENAICDYEENGSFDRFLACSMNKTMADGSMTLTAQATWGDRLFEYATITPQGVLFHDVTSIRLNESSVFEVRLPDGSLVNCADFLKLQ